MAKNPFSPSWVNSLRRASKCPWASPVAQAVKNLPAIQEAQVQSLDWEDPLEEGMATPSRILAWRIPQKNLAGYSSWGHTDRLSDQHKHANTPA